MTNLCQIQAARLREAFHPSPITPAPDIQLQFPLFEISVIFRPLDPARLSIPVDNEVSQGLVFSFLPRSVGTKEIWNLQLETSVLTTRTSVLYFRLHTIIDL